MARRSYVGVADQLTTGHDAFSECGLARRLPLDHDEGDLTLGDVQEDPLLCFIELGTSPVPKGP